MSDPIQQVSFFGQYLDDERLEVSVTTTGETIEEVGRAFEMFLDGMGYHPDTIAKILKIQGGELVE